MECESEKMIFFTSDHHFGHENIIKFCDRPFANVDEMDNALIDKWNGIVGPDDLVYHLGDFTLSGKRQARYYFSQLNGTIFVLGNWWHHDRRWLPGGTGKTEYGTASGHSVWIVDPVCVHGESWTGWVGRKQETCAIVLCHYAMRVWDRCHYGAWHLYGHSHGNLEPTGLSLDVGVDTALAGFGPVSLDTVIDYMMREAEKEHENPRHH